MKRIDKFENHQRVCQDIEAIAKAQCLTYIDASLAYAEKNNFEVEYVAELLSKNDLLRSRIEEEAEDLNFLKKKARLPI